MRAAADLHDVGIAENDAHVVARHKQEIGNDLREACLVTLTGRLRADDHVDASLRLHLDPRLLARRADRGLDVVCETQSKQFAASPRLAAAPGEAFPAA